MDLWKEVVFFSVCVGGGSEAPCLSSFNWFPVAIGAGASFSLPWKCSTSERTVWIQIYKKVSGELSRILHLSAPPLDDLQLTLEGMFSAEDLYYCRAVHVYVAVDLADL